MPSTFSSCRLYCGQRGDGPKHRAGRAQRAGTSARHRARGGRSACERRAAPTIFCPRLSPLPASDPVSPKGEATCAMIERASRGNCEPTSWIARPAHPSSSAPSLGGPSPLPSPLSSPPQDQGPQAGNHRALSSPTSWMRLTCTSSMASLLGSLTAVNRSMRAMDLALAVCFTSCQRCWKAGLSALARSSWQTRDGVTGRRSKGWGSSGRSRALHGSAARTQAGRPASTTQTASTQSRQLRAGASHSPQPYRGRHRHAAGPSTGNTVPARPLLTLRRSVSLIHRSLPSVSVMSARSGGLQKASQRRGVTPLVLFWNLQGSHRCGHQSEEAARKPTGLQGSRRCGRTSIRGGSTLTNRAAGQSQVRQNVNQGGSTQTTGFRHEATRVPGTQPWFAQKRPALKEQQGPKANCRTNAQEHCVRAADVTRQLWTGQRMHTPRPRASGRGSTLTSRGRYRRRGQTPHASECLIGKEEQGGAAGGENT